MNTSKEGQKRNYPGVFNNVHIIFTHDEFVARGVRSSALVCMLRLSLVFSGHYIDMILVNG